MSSRKTNPHLRDAAASGPEAVREAVAAGLAAATALRGAAAVTRQKVRLPPAPPKRGLAGLLDRTQDSKRLGKQAQDQGKKKVKGRDKATAQRGKPKDKSRKASRAAAAAARATTVAPLTATGWFILAGLILAWPRERSPYRIEGRIGNHLTGLRDKLRAEMASPTTEQQDLAQHEPGRGRDAQSPAQIPGKGWREILGRTWKEFNEDRITAVAGGITFFGLLALFPAMAAFVSLYGLFADTKDVGSHLRILAGVMPAEALKFFGEQMVRMAQTKGATLSLTFFTTLLLSLWSANSGVKAMFDGLNVAYEEKETRGFIKLNLVSLAFTVGAIVFLALAAGSVIAVPVVLGLIGFKLGGLAPVLDVARWPVLLLGVAVGLAVLYRYGPSRQHPKWAWITPGGLAAAVLWLVVSMLFSFYVAHFGSYNKTYGSLGAVVGFMTWIWLSTIVVLFGAELNAELEHQTAADTTTGPPERMGARGAKMADEVAPAAVKG